MTGPCPPLSEDPQKRDAILEQAIATFAELGFRGTDVQVIADRAGVGKGTVYRYFGNKNDLFWAASYEVMRRHDLVLFAAIAPEVTALSRLRAACLAFVEFFERNPACLEIFVQDWAEFRGDAPAVHLEHHEKLIGQFMEILEEGIQRGEVRPLDVRKTILSLGCILHGTVVLSSYPKFGLTITEMAEHAVDVFLTGLRPGASPIPGTQCQGFDSSGTQCRGFDSSATDEGHAP
jgi:AcrR family transcriptional regulator